MIALVVNNISGAVLLRVGLSRSFFVTVLARFVYLHVIGDFFTVLCTENPNFTVHNFIHSIQKVTRDELIPISTVYSA